MDTPSSPMPPSLPMNIGVPLDQLSILFFASLAAAIWLVYLFCQQKFSERNVSGSSDYIYQLLPRQLATHEEYSKGFLIYFGSMAAMVLLLALLGPQNLESVGITLPKALSYLTLPPAIALVLIGAMPNVPGLMMIEKYLRQYALERAYIPDAARAAAQRLAAADFDFSSYQGDALQSPEMRGVEPADFTRSRLSLEHSWARLCCLVFVQKSCRMLGLTDSLDASLLQDYEKDLELIESQKKSMEAQVAAYRAARASDPFYTNDALRHDIADNLYKLYILLGCAVRIKTQPDADIDLALRPFGFRLQHATRAQDMGDLKLVGLSTVAVSITLLGLAAYGLGQLGLWTMSPVFPQTMYQPFVDAASTLVPHATAIMVADLMRRHAINSGSWFDQPGRGTARERRQLCSGCAGLRRRGLCRPCPAGPYPASADGGRIQDRDTQCASRDGDRRLLRLSPRQCRDRPAPIAAVGARCADRADGALRAHCRLRDMADHLRCRQRGHRQDRSHHDGQRRRRSRACLVHPASRCRQPVRPAVRGERGAGARARGCSPDAIWRRRRREALARQSASRPGKHLAASRGGGKCGWVRERDRPAARSKGTGRLSMTPKSCRLFG